MDMATVKERIKELLDQLPESEAAELERLLLLLKARPDEASWPELASGAFASWFSDDEYEYPDDAGSPS
jgi:hypothetical protein